MNRVKRAVLSILTVLSVHLSMMPVSAGALADNLTPILEDVAQLFSGPMVTFAIAVVTLIIVFVILGFITGMFSKILDMIKI